MNERYNLYFLEALFVDYLRSENLSRLSIKNYKSDIRFYLSWLSAKHLRNVCYENSPLDSFILLSTESLIDEFKGYMLDAHLPIRTINRRLSSLRRFYAFCHERGVLSHNPASMVPNISREALNREIQDDSHLKPKDNTKLTLTQFKNFMRQRFGSDRSDEIIDSFEAILEMINKNK